MDITSVDVQNWIMTKATSEELELIKHAISTKSRLSLRIGDSVWFDAKTRGIIHGTISKINAKTIKVATPGGTWSVGPDLLHKDV